MRGYAVEQQKFNPSACHLLGADKATGSFQLKIKLKISVETIAVLVILRKFALIKK